MSKLLSLVEELYLVATHCNISGLQNSYKKLNVYVFGIIQKKINVKYLLFNIIDTLMEKKHKEQGNGL